MWSWLLDLHDMVSREVREGMRRRVGPLRHEQPNVREMPGTSIPQQKRQQPKHGSVTACRTYLKTKFSYEVEAYDETTYRL